MKSKDPYNKKISILVPIDLYNRLNKQVEWGERNKMVLRVIEWMVEKLETHGKDALVLLIRDGEMDKFIDMQKEKVDGNNS